MKVVFRADSSTMIGTGHVTRCMALAETLRDRGAEIHFVCRESPGNINRMIEAVGFTVHEVVDDARGMQNQDSFGLVSWKDDAAQTSAVVRLVGSVDWLVVDHYGIDQKWETAVQDSAFGIMVIDDLANRPHRCDILLDQNFQLKMGHRYNKLVRKDTKLLLGPKYALLREEFLRAREWMKLRNGEVRRVLVFFGGIDASDETSKTLRAITGHPGLQHLEWDVLVGINNPRRNEIEAMCKRIPNAHFLCQVGNMAELMASADLAIGAGGTTTWERCFLGLPTIVIVVAENQREVTQAVAMAGACWNLGWHEEVHQGHIQQAILHAMDKPLVVREMSTRAQALTSNHPGTELVASILCGVNGC